MFRSISIGIGLARLCVPKCAALLFYPNGAGYETNICPLRNVDKVELVTFDFVASVHVRA